LNLRVLIFDADNTLRRTLVPGQPCPHSAAEWALLDGVQACVSSLPHGLRLGVASNQDHVGYGLLSEADAHRLLVEALAAASGRTVDERAVRLCPHRLDVGCRCRKPAPGMLLDIVEYYGCSPAEALFVGDSLVDHDAAERARIPFCWSHEFFDVRRGLRRVAAHHR
jgi:D-glycero-D-manno-heptose 1,7-bisphosphate phosphatase